MEWCRSFGTQSRRTSQVRQTMLSSPIRRRQHSMRDAIVGEAQTGSYRQPAYMVRTVAGECGADLGSHLAVGFCLRALKREVSFAANTPQGFGSGSDSDPAALIVCAGCRNLVGYRHELPSKEPVIERLCKGGAGLARFVSTESGQTGRGYRSLASRAHANRTRPHPTGTPLTPALAETVLIAERLRRSSSRCRAVRHPARFQPTIGRRRRVVRKCSPGGVELLVP